MGTRITERDLELLGFVAEHRLVLAAHVAALLRTSEAAANARLRALASAGFLHSEPGFQGQPRCHLITRKGLAAVGCGFRSPRVDPCCYRHDVGLAWLWLAARAGRFGPLREVISERRLRSLDADPDRCDEPVGVRLSGFGPAGKPRLHYPDLVLVLEGGQRVAVELELTSKGRGRREKILLGYAADSRIDVVLYLVDRPATARAIQASTRQIGISALVRTQWVQWEGTPLPGAGRTGASRERARSATAVAR
jgi:hypothetical protein